MSIQEYHAKRKLFYERFGSVAQKLEDYAVHCFCKYGYGFYNNEVGNAIHRNKVALYNEKGRYYKLSKTDIYNHFLSTDKSDYLWFTASTKLKDELKMVPIVLDFDNKEDIEPSLFFSRIKQSLSGFDLLKDRWLNHSTHGSGVHCHVLLAFDKRVSRDDIRDSLNKLQSDLKRSIVGFDCVRGHPRAFDGRQIGVCGTLALAPLLKSEADAIAFLKQLEPINVQKLQESLNASSLLSSTTVTDCRTNRALPKEQTLTQENIQSKSPNERMIYAGQIFAQKNKRLPMIVELVLYYEELGLHTGKDKKNRRVKRAEEAIEYIARTFDASKTKIPFSIKDAEELFVKLAIHPEDLLYTSNQSLSMEEVHKYAVYFTQLITIPHDNKELDGTVSQVQMKKYLKISGQKYSRLKHIMNDYDVIKTLSNSYIVGGPGKGVSKKYCFGKNHPLYK